MKKKTAQHIRQNTTQLNEHYSMVSQKIQRYLNIIPEKVLYENFPQHVLRRMMGLLDELEQL